MSTFTERVQEVEKKRRELVRTLKKEFFEVMKECPCCKKENSCINVSFWFGNSGFSVKSPKWAIKCTACEFHADFWVKDGEAAAKRFGKAFREAVALRLMGLRKKMRRKKK